MGTINSTRRRRGEEGGALAPHDDRREHSQGKRRPPSTDPSGMVGARSKWIHAEQLARRQGGELRETLDVSLRKGANRGRHLVGRNQQMRAMATFIRQHSQTLPMPLNIATLRRLGFARFIVCGTLSAAVASRRQGVDTATAIVADAQIDRTSTSREKLGCRHPKCEHRLEHGNLVDFTAYSIG